MKLILQDHSDVNKDTKTIEEIDHVFSTIPANKLMGALPQLSSLQRAKSLLNQMKHTVNVAVVNLVYKPSKVD